MPVNRSQIILTIIAILVHSSNALAGGILLVDDDALPGGDGTRWDTAYRFLQDALATADGGGISEIHVAQGTYTPDRDEANPKGTGDREATFQLINGVAIMGGYAGIGAKDPDARDVELYETILSGDLLGNDEANFINYQENSLHVLTSDVAAITAILDGLVITSGNADGSGEDFIDKGGGLLCVDSDTTITDCRFQSNRADSMGGALLLWNTSPLLTNCSFVNNETDGPSSSGRGGALFATGSPSLENCHFSGNFAQHRGGAISGQGGSDLSIMSCSFVDNNSAGRGGAYHNRADPTFIGCMFYNNQAGGGGAVASDSGLPTFIECEFVGNQGIEGGAFNNGSESPTFLRCLFAQNLATETGGAVWNHSHGATGAAHNPAFISCVFTGNTAGENGGAIATASWLTLHHTTISQNSATINGGGIYMIPNNPKVIASNSILWGNTDANQSSEGSQLYVVNNNLNVNYCCIQGLTGSFGGVGNIADDPLFVNPNGPDGLPGTIDDDFHLLPESPCINAGDPNPGIDIPALDLDGEDRIQQCRLDIGIDETPFWFDCNTNGISDACDIAENRSQDVCGNGIPDECEEDCNENGTPDQCELHPVLDISSGMLSPFGTGFPQTLLLQNPPIAVGTVNLFFSAHADLSGTSRRIDVELNGEFVGTVFPHEELGCADPPSIDQLILSADAYNMLLAGGDAEITMLPEGGSMDPEACAHGTFVSVQIIYEPQSVTQDCNDNEIPDECDIDSGNSLDCNGNGIPDECDVDLLDCNGNGIPDDCDIADGTSEDIDGNGIPDECKEDCNNNGVIDIIDIQNGTSEDCNGNGVPDECDLTDGTSLDCNANGIPDECDIADGTSEDCNNNNSPDECDITDAYAESGPLGPIGLESPQSFTFNNPPIAAEDVVLSFTAIADLLSVVEFIDVDINGIAFGSVFVKGAQDCPETPDMDQLVILSDDYNDAISGGDAVITMTATNAVNPLSCSGENFITVTIQYESIGSSNDLNDNGIPDECETPGDLDGDGVIGTSDLLILLSSWGPCDDCDNCVADLDGDCNVGTSDLLILLSNWG